MHSSMHRVQYFIHNWPNVATFSYIFLKFSVSKKKCQTFLSLPICTYTGWPEWWIPGDLKLHGNPKCSWSYAISVWMCEWLMLMMRTGAPCEVDTAIIVWMCVCEPEQWRKTRHIKTGFSHFSIYHLNIGETTSVICVRGRKLMLVGLFCFVFI